MTRCTRVLVALATVTATLAVTVGAGALAGPALAAGFPLPADPAAKGYIGLCDEAGQNVTGGSVDTRPFVWKAVATTAPPSSYQGRGQNSVLGILQPRRETEPVEWGGTSLTASSYYRQRGAPAAQATYGDQSLRSVIKRYPPEVDGLYVLRMYFGKDGYGVYSTTYPTTTIQVTGSTWRVVRGGTVNCHAATAVSEEQLTGAVSRKLSAPHRPSSTDRTVETAHSRVISETPESRSSTGGTAPAASRSGGATTLSSSPAAETSTSSTPSWVVWLLGAVVVLLVLALLAVLRTRRRASSTS